MGARSPATDAVLAIDLGTSGLKVAFVTFEGQVLAHELTAIPTTRLPGGGAVQDPSAWWAAVVSSVRHLLAEQAVRPEQVAAVTCTGQWGSTVPVGADGRAVGPCLLWMDGRGQRHSSKVLRGRGPLRIEGYGPLLALRFIRKTSGAPTPLGNDPLGHALYLRNEDPATYGAATVLLEPVDFLSLCFTGRVAATPGSMILSWLVDIRDLEHPAYAADLVRVTTRDRGLLPALLPTGSVVGTVTAAVAEASGLPAGVPVVAGTPDLLSGCTGSGALGDFEAHMAVSTSAWLSCHVPFKKTDPLRQVASVPGVLPGRYLLANNHDTAGACLEWLRAATSVDGQLPSYAALDAVAATAPAGSGGVLFAPWLAGERCPVDDRTLRGSFLNLSLTTSRAEMLRAVYEGVAMNARWMQGAVEHFLERRLGPIRFIGGGASSALWCQIHADVLDRPVHQVEEPLLANVRGAALFAALSLGRLGAAEVARAVKVTETFVPSAEHSRTYRELYAHFRTLYRHQRRMYASLNRPSGPFDDRVRS